MKRLMFIFCLSFVGMVHAGYDCDDASIREFEKSYRRCMEQQDSTITSGENCINDYVNKLVNNCILSVERSAVETFIADQKKLKWIQLYQQAIEKCRLCEKRAWTQEGKAECYRKIVGLNGFSLLDHNEVRLSADKLINDRNAAIQLVAAQRQKNNNRLVQRAAQEASFKSQLEQLGRDLEERYVQCCQNANGDDVEIKSCWNEYVASMHRSGLEVPEACEQKDQGRGLFYWFFRW